MIVDTGVREFLGVISILLGIYGTAIYVRSVLAGKTRPHLFTWLIWALLSAIVTAAQITEGAGEGAWTTAYLAFTCGLSAALAVKYGEKNITRSDWACLFSCFVALGLWLATEDPFWSVILISVVDVVAFVPTFRKSWHRPWQEDVGYYHNANLRCILGIVTLAQVSVTTLLYPLVVLLGNTAFIILVLWRRRVLRREAAYESRNAA